MEERLSYSYSGPVCKGRFNRVLVEAAVGQKPCGRGAIASLRDNPAGALPFRLQPCQRFVDRQLASFQLGADPGVAVAAAGERRRPEERGLLVAERSDALERVERVGKRVRIDAARRQPRLELCA